MAIQQNTPRNLHVIKASAGSGKTFTLAKIYIEKLLWDDSGALRKQRNYHQHILAITFTNKATDEMKLRIVERLDELSQGKCHDYQNAFLDAHPSTTTDQLKQAAHNALEDILFDYTRFNVSTIDSFFQSILRTFAHELDREDYEVQLDNEFVSRNAVHNFMASMGSNSANNDWLENYIHNNIKGNIESKKDAIFFGSKSVGSILKFSEELYKESFLNHRNEIKNYLNDIGSGKGPSRLAQFMKALGEKRQEHRKYCDDFPTTLNDFFTRIGLEESDLNAGNNLTKMAFGNLKFKEPTVTIISYVDNNNGLIQCTKKCAKSIAEKNNDEFCKLLKKLINHHMMMKMLSEIEHKLYSLAFLNQIDNYIEQFRKETNTVLISDTNDLITRVLESGVDFLYERVGTWINNFMIDEFQDTSQKQYSNFKPLLNESLSTGNANLIIGDEKQSIYRFRNSDSDLLRTQIKDDYSRFYNDDTILDTNFRSSQNVVKFNNEFFKYLIFQKHHNCTKICDTYSNVEQKVCPASEKSNIKGYVRINVIDKSYKADDETNTGSEHMLNQLPNYILHLHNDHHIPFGKMLILVNRHTDGDKVIECLLQHNMEHPEQHIDIVSAESLKLKNSPSVRLIISVLQFLNNTIFHDSDEDSTDNDKTDDMSKPNWEKIAKQRQLDKQFLNKLVHDFSKEMETAGDNADPSQLLVKVIRDNDNLRKSTVDEQISVYNSITEALMPNPFEETSGLESLVDRIIKQYVESTGALNNGAETAFLLAFQKAVCDFCNMRNCGGSIYEFLKYWENKKEKLSVESNANSDAVEVMTIHAAKGLERTCVIIPFANWDLRTDEKMVWLPRENWLEENDANKPFCDISTNDKGECIVPPIIPTSDKMLNECNNFSAFQKPRIEDQLLDTINKTYVAFTRARQSLHIFAFNNASKNNASIPKIGPLLCEFAQSSGLFTAHTLKENNPEATTDDNAIDYYDMGTEATFMESNKADTNSEECTMPMPDYHVSDNSGALKVNLPNYISNEQESGIRMHYILARIRWKRDVTRALRHAERRIINTRKDPYWNLERVKQVVDNMFSDPNTAEWFDDANKVYNEKTLFFFDSNHEWETRRPDRVVVRPDGTTIIIDYKFGDAPTEEQRKGYNNQVKRYMRILSNMGHHNIKGYVWYAKENTVNEVTL